MPGFTQEQLEYFHAMSREKFELDMQSIATDARDEGRAESRQVIAEKDRAIAEKDRAIAELRQKLRAAGLE
ncbi:hypothetical protein AGMMS4952_09090 [Spirochaetia bacterium]|nr:hypothetical protein AGMMS4952_09090 [Spirochaetia bacterium]